jgi:hypothetical protein
VRVFGKNDLIAEVLLRGLVEICNKVTVPRVVSVAFLIRAVCVN